MLPSALEQMVSDGECIMSWGEFRGSVECTAFTDYDGHGYPINAEGVINHDRRIIPSESAEMTDVEFIVWFNR
jgi:hypothetical protein